jgi:AcrR family transcriptional regulator
MASNRLTSAAPAVREIKYKRRYGEILDAAAAVFAEKGYHGASTKDIADRLGIRQGSLYYYFTSKEVALAEVCRIGVDGFVKGLTAILATDDAPADKLRAAVLNHMAPIASRRHYVKVFLKERQNLTGAALRDVKERAEEYERLFERLLAEGIAAGAVRADLDRRLSVLAALGMCNSAVDWFDPARGRIDAIARQYADILIDGLGCLAS